MNNPKSAANIPVPGIPAETAAQNIPAKPVLDVYLMRIPENIRISDVCPAERNNQIRGTINQSKRTERFAVWRLLETAILRSFGLGIAELDLSVSKGKWSCDKLSFSLSHSHGAVAVAVSTGPCGVDIENLNAFMLRHNDGEFIEKIMRRICSESQLSAPSSAEEVLSVWTKKESIFKCYGSNEFFFGKIDAQSHPCETVSVDLGDKYILSVCGDELASLRCYVTDEQDI